MEPGLITGILFMLGANAKSLEVRPARPEHAHRKAHLLF